MLCVCGPLEVTPMVTEYVAPKVQLNRSCTYVFNIYVFWDYLVCCGFKSFDLLWWSTQEDFENFVECLESFNGIGHGKRVHRLSTLSSLQSPPLFYFPQIPNNKHISSFSPNTWAHVSVWLQRAGAGGLVRAEGRAGRRRSWARGGWLIPNTNTCTNANTNTNTNANTNWMYSGCSHLKLTKRNTCPFLWPNIPWKCKPWRYFQMIIVVSNKLLCANAYFFTLPKRMLKLREVWYLQKK